jgi:uncharacterized YccA/Bax inhibitor family protein
MALFKSSNPALSSKVFDNTPVTDYNEVMTMRGTMNKFGFMLLMLLGSAYYSWKEFAEGGNVQPLMLTGLIGGLIVAFVIIYKKEWASYLAPIYGLLEGLALGAISSMYNMAFAKIAPNIVMNAVGLTFGTAIAMYFLYNFKIIKVTERLKSVIISAMGGILVFYVITMVMGLFHVNIAFLNDSSPLSIGISLVIVVVASLNLLLNFDMIEQGSQAGAPKYMEWYCAFGLMVAIVWLYVEILGLLAKLSGNRR